MCLSQLARLENNEEWVRMHATEYSIKINVLGNFLINIIHGKCELHQMYKLLRISIL
jgi:hypothetical protein